MIARRMCVCVCVFCIIFLDYRTHKNGIRVNACHACVLDTHLTRAKQFASDMFSLEKAICMHKVCCDCLR